MAIYNLAYYESLIVFLVGPEVCVCNQTLHRNVCIPIGGGGVLIDVVYLFVLLIDEAFYPTVECVIMHLH